MNVSPDMTCGLLCVCAYYVSIQHTHLAMSRTRARQIIPLYNIYLLPAEHRVAAWVQNVCAFDVVESGGEPWIRSLAGN